MRQVTVAPDQVRDPFEKNVPGIGVGRDGCRTPMQWDATSNAGFSTSTPWLPLAGDFPRHNAVTLDADAHSILGLYRALIKLRKQLPQLAAGAYEPMAAQGDLLLYRRRAAGEALVIALNLGAEPASVTSSAIGFGSQILLSTFLDRKGEILQGVLNLRGNEGVIIGRSDEQSR
jgi:alpha-glucosidase